MSKPRRIDPGSVLAAGTIVAGRWLALVATAYFSLFHWMRSEYLEFSHVWQYGLPLLDPRVAAALLWWGLYSFFLVVVLLPLAHWLADRTPTSGTVRWAAWVALALGLGTRGIAGPVVMRAALAQPVRLLPGGGEMEGGPLTETLWARSAVALTEAWWMLPLLVVAIRAAAGTPALRHLYGRRAAAVLVIYALVQSPEAAYLLTGGGPRGATASFPLLAFQLGFGGQEFGYASVLTVLMSVLVAAGMLLVGMRPAERTVPARRPPVGPADASALWWIAPAVVLTPLFVGYLRNPPETAAEPRLAAWTVVSIATAAAAAAWMCLLLPALARMVGNLEGARFRRAFWFGPLMLPSLVWILPAIRVFGEQRGWVDALTPSAGLILGAPYLYLGLGVLTLCRERKGEGRRAAFASALVVAWATWTDLLNPLMLTQTDAGAVMLPTGMVWALSTHLWSSPLSAPGWIPAWIGAVVLVLPALVALLETDHEHTNSS